MQHFDWFLILGNLILLFKKLFTYHPWTQTIMRLRPGVGAGAEWRGAKEGKWERFVIVSTIF